MPIEAEIPLMVRGGQTGPGSPGYSAPGVENTIDLVGKISQTQQQITATKTARDIYAARQRAGQIMAGARSVEEGIAALQNDPLTTGFAPELAQTAAGTLNVLTQQAGQVQTQAQDAYKAMMSGLPAVLADQGMFPALRKSVLDVTSPYAKGAVARSIDNFKAGLLAPGPGGRPATLEDLNRRLIGTVLATGNGDSLKGILGSTGVTNVGGAVVPYVQAPIQGGVYGEPGGSVRLAPVEGGGGAAANPLAIQGTAPAPGSVQMPPPQQQAEAPDEFRAMDGGTLKIGVSPRIGAGLAGMPMQSGPQAARNDKLVEQFSGEGMRQYNNAIMTQGLLHEMDANFDQLIKGGNDFWTTPGTAAGLRLGFGKLVGTVAQIAGKKPEELSIDPSKIASAEQLVKDTRRLGLTYGTSMLGTQREAADTINKVMQAVPGIDNSYLGAKLMLGSIKAMTDRAVDLHNFQNQWMQDPRNQGMLTGAEEAFNKQRPFSYYTDKVLNEFGMDEHGFKTKEAIFRALDSGYLTRDQAVRALEEEFPTGDKGPRKGK